MYYQMMSYLIEEGQIGLLSSQLVARQCYQVALEYSRHPTARRHVRSHQTQMNNSNYYARRRKIHQQLLRSSHDAFHTTQIKSAMN